MSKSLSPVCFCLVVFGAISATVLLATHAYAGVPCAGTSDVVVTAGCGSYCPEGDMDTVMVTVTLRDCYGTPLAGRWVEIEPIIEDSTHYFCPLESPVLRLTDTEGRCDATFNNFGGCDTRSGDGGDCGLEFSAECETTELGPSNRITTASPDADADGDVDLQDFIYFASVYGTDECCCDFDCDSDVDLQDFIKFAGHYGHKCPLS